MAWAAWNVNMNRLINVNMNTYEYWLVVPSKVSVSWDYYSQYVRCKKCSKPPTGIDQTPRNAGILKHQPLDPRATSKPRTPVGTCNYSTVVCSTEGAAAVWSTSRTGSWIRFWSGKSCMEVWENHGKSWKNHGKSWEISWKIMENQQNHGTQ